MKTIRNVATGVAERVKNEQAAKLVGTGAFAYCAKHVLRDQERIREQVATDLNTKVVVSEVRDV